MKIREDFEYLTMMVQDKMINLVEAKELAALPLLVVPNETFPENVEFKNFWEGYLDDKKIRNKETSFDEIEDLPFFDFVVMYNFHKNWKKVMRVKPGVEVDEDDRIIYCRFTFDRDSDTIRKSYSCNGKIWASTEGNISDGHRNINFDECVLKIKGLPEWSEQYKELRNIAIETCFGSDIHGVFTAAIMWHRYHGLSDRYVISVKQNRSPKVVNIMANQIAKVLGPRIIYLDKMPSENEEVVSESGYGCKAPHQRKGHWATLKHERYKYHPKYMIKNGVYRKPAWIGDRTRIVHGATYTVIDKQVNLEE